MIFGGAVARRADIETSHDAADSVDVTTGQQMVLDVLRRYGAGDGGNVGLTDEELVAMLPFAYVEPLSPSGARSRRAELVRRGLVVWTGEYAYGKSGRRARVWRAV